MRYQSSLPQGGGTVGDGRLRQRGSDYGGDRSHQQAHLWRELHSPQGDNALRKLRDGMPELRPQPDWRFVVDRLVALNYDDPLWGRFLSTLRGQYQLDRHPVWLAALLLCYETQIRSAVRLDRNPHRRRQRWDDAGGAAIQAFDLMDHSEPKGITRRMFSAFTAALHQKALPTLPDAGNPWSSSDTVPVHAGTGHDRSALELVVLAEAQSTVRRELDEAVRNGIIREDDADTVKRLWLDEESLTTIADESGRTYECVKKRVQRARTALCRHSNYLKKLAE